MRPISCLTCQQATHAVVAAPSVVSMHMIGTRYFPDGGMEHNNMAETFLIIASIPIVLLRQVIRQTFLSPHHEEASSVADPMCPTRHGHRRGIFAALHNQRQQPFE